MIVVSKMTILANRKIWVLWKLLNNVLFHLISQFVKIYSYENIFAFIFMLAVMINFWWSLFVLMFVVEQIVCILVHNKGCTD
jgi:hypothetical protein